MQIDRFLSVELLPRYRTTSCVDSHSMGAGTSSLLVEEIDEICESTNLTQNEVRSLYVRFLRLDKQQTGKLTVDSLMMIPELAMNPLAPRLTAVFSEVNFREFAEILCVFGKKNTAGNNQQLKREFIFKLYDVDNDGHISKDDLCIILRLVLGQESVEDEIVRKLAADMVNHADGDGDGMISLVEFARAINDDHLKLGCTVEL